MANKLMGQAILVVNGLPVVNVKSISTTTRIAREVVKGMRPDGRPVGMVDGPEEYSIELELYVPASGPLPWKSITNGVLYLVGRDGVGSRELANGVFVTEVGLSVSESGAATQKVSAQALFLEAI